MNQDVNELMNKYIIELRNQRNDEMTSWWMNKLRKLLTSELNELMNCQNDNNMVDNVKGFEEIGVNMTCSKSKKSLREARWINREIKKLIVSIVENGKWLKLRCLSC